MQHRAIRFTRIRHKVRNELTELVKASLRGLSSRPRRPTRRQRREAQTPAFGGQYSIRLSYGHINCKFFGRPRFSWTGVVDKVLVSLLFPKTGT